MSEHSADVDREIRARVSDTLRPGELVVSWCSIAGVRSPEGGGYVLLDRSDDAPPDWQVRGMLWEALASLDHRQLITDYYLDDEE